MTNGSITIVAAQKVMKVSILTRQGSVSFIGDAVFDGMAADLVTLQNGQGITITARGTGLPIDNFTITAVYNWRYCRYYFVILKNNHKMKDIIISELHRVFSIALLRFANQYKQDAKLFYISLFLDEDKNVAYNLCYDGSPIQPLTILNILNVKLMDLKGYSVIVPPHIKSLLEELQNQYSEFIEVNVHLGRKEDGELDEEMVRLFYLIGQNL